MPSRILLVFTFGFLSSLLALARDDDPAKERIFKAKEAYTAEIAKLRSEVIAGHSTKPRNGPRTWPQNSARG